MVAVEDENNLPSVIILVAVMIFLLFLMCKAKVKVINREASQLRYSSL